MTSIIFLFFLVPALAFILIALNLLLAPHLPYKEKNSEFECGFHSFLGQNRSQFSISFFLFGLLFLVFDLEIVLIYPYAVSAYSNGSYGLTIVFIFLVILTVGFCFEIGKKALSINSKQSNNVVSGSTSVLNFDYESVKAFNKKTPNNLKIFYHSSFLGVTSNNSYVLDISFLWLLAVIIIILIIIFLMMNISALLNPLRGTHRARHIAPNEARIVDLRFITIRDLSHPFLVKFYVYDKRDVYFASNKVLLRSPRITPGLHTIIIKGKIYFAVQCIQSEAIDDPYHTFRNGKILIRFKATPLNWTNKGWRNRVY